MASGKIVINTIQLSITWRSVAFCLRQLVTDFEMPTIIDVVFIEYMRPSDDRIWTQTIPKLIENEIVGLQVRNAPDYTTAAATPWNTMLVTIYCMPRP